MYRPVFFRLIEKGDEEALEQLLNTRPWIRVYDTIHAQLRELVKTSIPKETLKDNEIEPRIHTHLAGTPIDQYGVWVYYPWNDKLVHLLDEKEFVFMRTNRNKYKITDEEEEILATKRIGVVGLSVGQAVSVTMAMERTFGELRIADFDDLEITNLNRLRSSVYNMGLKKTIQVARDIAEIDPFLKITLFSEGLTTTNMDAFFTEGGKLDLVIDECDGLDMKILLRHKAKALRIPVLMEASDRGTVDVERFDLEPDRAILHGFIDHLDHTKIGSLTNDEKIPYIMPMLGLDTISKRLRASMVEIKQTISTWPQLASAVALGGALCADVCRRIMLNKYSSSGRYFVDIEELIGDKPQKMEGTYEVREMPYPRLTEQQMLQLAGAHAAPSSAISAGDLQQVAQAAIEAPSAANNQPWKLLSKDGALYLFHDKQQSYSWTDPIDFIARISLGAALENIIIKAASLGFEAHYTLFPAGEDQPLVATIAFRPSEAVRPLGAPAMYIGTRCTNRKRGDNAPLPAGIYTDLATACARVADTKLTFLTDPDIINAFADIESAAERVRSLHPQSHHEFFHKELRWNDSGTEKITEGLDIKTLELTVAEEMGMRIGSDPGVIALLNQWRTGKVFEKLIRLSIRSSSAVGLVSVPQYSAAHLVNGGRAVEQVWLEATRHHLSVQPISAPLFLHARAKYAGMDGEDPNMVSEIYELYGKLCTLFPELHDRHGLFLFRLFKAEPPTARSLRKSINELYTIA
ncbi:Rv1355c family protein [Nemorincola caseinilytica]|uniref:Rv1355c family protein n=2 Tax=Nemorincola caseinilytica TaxID=2054315 RepID=A0ABP8NLU1_9BACT